MKEIDLTKGYVTKVDDDLFDELNQYLWHVLDSHPRHRYAARWIPNTNPRKCMRMHHQILRIDTTWLRRNGLVIDHEDRNGLNNQRNNISVVTRSQNAKNSDHWDNCTWIRWDCYRSQYKVVRKDSSFIAWAHTLEDAIAIRDQHHA